MAKHRVTISMDPESTEALARSGYALYAFAAVQCADAAALPLVWIRTESYSAFTYLEWTDAYEAYTSSSLVAPGSRVDVGFAAPAQPGQTLRVTSPRGIGVVEPGPDPAAVWITNDTDAPFACGVARQHDRGFAPTCVLPLYGGGADRAEPLSTVLLMFSTVQAAPGTAVQISTGPGVLLNVTGERTVRYDINEGWRAEGTQAAVAVPPLTPLVPLLLHAPPQVKTQLLVLAPYPRPQPPGAPSGPPRTRSTTHPGDLAMPTTVELANETTKEIDIGNSKGLSASNVSTKNAEFYIDYFQGGAWKPVFGTITLKPAESKGWTRVGIGHDNVRVAAKGDPNGRTIVKVTY